jgi:hypothetical protein
MISDRHARPRIAPSTGTGRATCSWARRATGRSAIGTGLPGKSSLRAETSRPVSGTIAARVGGRNR